MATHRLVAEARMNGLTLVEFLARLNLYGQDGLVFLDPKVWAVHHKDFHSRNNEPGNLEVMTHEAHRALHAGQNAKNVLDKLVPVRVDSVKDAGIKETFDLEVEGVHAFIANDVAVHNSGKTTAALGFIARVNRPALVVVWTGGLLDQWVERIAAELKVPVKQIGIIGGGKYRTAPITVTMEQTLARGIDPDVLKMFGVIVADELQRFAAPTLFGAIDPWPGRYRVGFSADETRKDKREFMIYDLFGGIACDIPQSEVLAAGKVVDVDIYVHPTEFRVGGWYKHAMMSGNRWQMNAAHRKLIEALTGDEPRNRLIRDIVAADVAAGEQMAVLAARREHCLLLDLAFVSMGIRSGIMLGGPEGKAQFKLTKEGIRAGTTRVVVGTEKSIGTGQDFPSVSSGALVMPMASNKQLFGQIRGRFCRACERIGKTGATLHYLWDRNVYGRKALENIVKWNKVVMVKDEEGGWVEGRAYLARMRGISRADFTETETMTVGELTGGE